MGRWWEIQATWLLTTHYWHLVAQMVKNLPSMWGTQFPSLGWEDPLEKGIATHSSILAWGISRTEEPVGATVNEVPRVGYDWATNTFTFWHLGFWSKSGWSQIKTCHLNVLSLCDLGHVTYFGCAGSSLLCADFSSSCGKWGLLSGMVPKLLTAVASLVAEHGL